MSDFFNDDNQQYIEIAELTTTCNKYHPGKQTFYIPALNPMNTRPNSVTTTQGAANNIDNAEEINANSTIESCSNIVLELPKEIARNYPTKFIPPGTRFLICFIGGDLTKPVIIGREYDGYQVQDSE